MPAEVLAQAFSVNTGDPAAFPVKELEAQYEDSAVEIGTASVRLFVGTLHRLAVRPDPGNLISAGKRGADPANP